MNTKTWKQRLWVIASTVVIVAAVAVLVRTGKPKLYQGKTVSEWVVLLDPHVSQRVQRDAASWAIVQIGSNAVPELQRILARRRTAMSSLTDKVRGYAIRFGFAKPPPIHPLELQSRACEAAYNLAERSNVDITSLIPHLTYHFTNGTYADSPAPRALAGAGSAGIAVLTNLLFTGNRNVRDQSGWAMNLYPATRRKPEVYTALIRAASGETNGQLRANFLLYLTGSRAPAEQVVPLGLRSLRTGDAYERGMAAGLLKDYTSDENVRKALEEAVQTKE